MSANLEKDRDEEIKEYCFPYPKDEAEIAVNKLFVERANKTYSVRKAAYDSNIAAWGAQGASAIPGYSDNRPVVMGSATAPFAVRHPTLAVILFLLQFFVIGAIVLGVALGISSLFLP